MSLISAFLICLVGGTLLVLMGVTIPGILVLFSALFLAIALNTRR